MVSLDEPLQDKSRSRRTVAGIHALIHNGQLLPVEGKLLLYFRNDSAAARLACGDAVLLCATLQPVVTSGNPGAFDYRQYCAYRQLYYQANVEPGRWKRTAVYKATVIDQYLLRGRNWCVRTLQRYIGRGPEAALAAALLIGYRYDLDKGTVQAYTNAGVVHIIAISGMHLALIYATLLWLLQWGPANRFSDTLRAVIIITLLWVFSLIAGAAASILRAAVMFSIIAAGRLLLKRYTNTYNTLAASAFLLLCFDPWLLLDAGFQLSYTAILGILLCYRPLYDLWKIRYNWPDKLWQATAVTLAAQALTLPVCLYYFHQFPNLFLPANLLVVVLSTIILYMLILLLLLSPVPVAAHYTGIAVKFLITCMNRIALFIEQLPYAVTSHIYMPLYAVCCAYLLMAALLAVWLGRRRQGCIAALAVCLAWSVLFAADTILCQRRRQAVIYNVPGHTAIDIMAESRVQFAGDTTLLRDSLLRERYLVPARMQYRVSTGLLPMVRQQGGFIRMGNKRLVIVDSTWRAFVPGKKFYADYILLSHRPKLSITQLKDMFVFKMIIFDASNPLWQIQQWKNDCSALTLRCFSVPDQGAYLINF